MQGFEETVVGIESKRIGHGLVFGKFMPPHNGHLHLCNTAMEACHKVTILVCSLPDEPISGHVRYKWMKRLYPNANVIHHDRVIPQEPKEHPDFYNIWKKSILDHCPDEEFDAIFASEDYGYKMAQIMETKFIPVDQERDLVPISGTKMRENPMEYWEHLNPVIRPYFAKKFAVIGPENSGKEELTNALSAKYKTIQFKNYAKSLLSNYARNIEPSRGEKPDFDDISTIARGITSGTKSLVEQCNRRIFVNSELIATKYWSEYYHGKCPSWVEKELEQQDYDVYFLVKPSENTKEDNFGKTRSFEERQKMFKALEAELLRREKKFQIIDELSLEDRVVRCSKYIEATL